jgi:hypothetical protein
MSSTELKMQPTIHLQRKTEFYRVHIQVCFANVLWVAFLVLLSPSLQAVAKFVNVSFVLLILIVSITLIARTSLRPF